MGIIKSYQMRLRRRQLVIRAWRKRRELRNVVNRTDLIKAGDVVLCMTLRNESVRLPYFFDYYRALGVNHFLIVDNDSEDSSGAWLAGQPDVSLWASSASYKKSRFGMDWLNHLMSQYADGHWCLTVDPDEFFVYPFCDTRPIHALTDWLDASDVRSFGAMLLDMYPKGGINDIPYRVGQNPLEISDWFDSGNYTYKRNPQMGNLWIQGGARARKFFTDAPEQAPALNKVPLVKWDRSYTYVSSTHSIYPRGLNLVYDESGGEKASGILLHMKFLNTLALKAAEERKRGEHYAEGNEYKAYADASGDNPSLWHKWSEKYINWRQLEVLGLMSKGNWA